MSYDPASYVEGVPVKISEKYRPPRKVNVSLSCIHHVNTHILTTEYNVSVENETLKWLQNIRTHKENKIRLREEKIRQYEEQKEKKKEEEERLKQQKLEEEREKQKKKEEERIKQQKLEEERQKQIQEENEKKYNAEKEDKEMEDNPEEEVKEVDAGDEDENKEEEEEENKSNKEMGFGQPDVSTEPTRSNETQAHHLKSESVSVACYPHNPVVNYNYQSTTQPSYLQPANSLQSPYTSPVLVPTQFSSQTPYQKSPTKSGNKINFADFEGDGSDPFDSVALKSINDMEELAKILQASNIKQQKVDPGLNTINFGYQQPGGYMNGGYQYNNPYVYASYPQPNPIGNASLFSQLSSYQSKVPSSSTTSSVPLIAKNNAAGTMFQQDGYPHTNYSQWNHVPPNSSSRTTAAAEAQPQNYKSYNYAMPPTGLPPPNVSMENPLSSTVVSGFPIMPPSTQSGTPLTSGMPATLETGMESVSKRPDLEDFYSRYYSNKKSPSSKARSGSSTPTNLLQQASKGTTTLSSSSSVPDLTVVEDNEVSSIVSSNNSENSSSKAVLGNRFLRARPSSTEGYEGLMSRGGFQLPAKPQTTHGQKFRLPDPFTELTEDAQTLVQSMAEMGFPRARVARAVQQLGTDHKKLLEVLLTLQSFQENGEDEVRSERAFYYFMGEVDRVREFLQAAKTLLDLGFEEERVVEGLFKHHNDKEKCLEELIG